MDVKIEALKILKQLFTKSNFSDAKLVDGTIVSAEAFEPGMEIFLLDEAGNRIPAPDGEHTLEDGSKVIVTDGKIESITKSETEDGIDEEVKIEEMEVEVEVEDEVEEVKEEEDQILNLKKLVDELMSKVNSIEEEMGKIKMSSDQKNEAIVNSIEELSDNFSKIPGGDKIIITPNVDNVKSDSDLTARMRVIKSS